MDKKIKVVQTRDLRKGFSLVEILVVVAIIGILISGAVMVGGYVTTKAKIQKTETAIKTLDTALRQYQQYHASNPLFEFPAGNIPPTVTTPVGDPPPGGLFTDFDRIVVIYNTLNTVPACREILVKIPESNLLLYSDGINTVNVVVDAWRNDRTEALNWLRYEYVPGSGNFPVIRSAGPDTEYGTADDILSTEIQG